MTIPYVKRGKLSNGLQYFNHEESYLPLAKIRIAFHGGGTAVPPDKAGAIVLLYDYLVSSQDALLVEFDKIGTTPVFYVDENGSAIDVTVNSTDIEKAFELLSKMLRKPQFDQVLFERVKFKHIAGVSESRRSPGESAKAALVRSIYGAEHPLGTLRTDTFEWLQSAKIEDLNHVYDWYTGPRDIAVITTGRISDNQAHMLCQSFFGDWRSDADPAESIPKAIAVNQGQHFFVARANLQKAYVALGGHGASLGDNDEYAFRMAARVLSDRLGRLFHHNNSFCSTEAEIHMFKRTGYYSMACSIDRGQTWQAALDIASAEFVSAMDYVDGARMPYFRSSEAWNIVNSFRSLHGVIENISSIYWNDLPDDYYIKSLEKINHVTLSDVERALHEYFRKDQIHVVVVGDPSPARRNTKRLQSP